MVACTNDMEGSSSSRCCPIKPLIRTISVFKLPGKGSDHLPSSLLRARHSPSFLPIKNYHLSTLPKKHSQRRPGDNIEILTMNSRLDEGRDVEAFSNQERQRAQREASASHNDVPIFAARGVRLRRAFLTLCAVDLVGHWLL